MAVLVEAISVVVRHDAIDKRFLGGWQGFLDQVPNNTFCGDGFFARVGFMNPEVEAGNAIQIPGGLQHRIETLTPVKIISVYSPARDLGTLAQK
jgi:hypothetical protein